LIASLALLGLAFVAAAGTLHLLRRYRTRLPQATPSERSLHRGNVPRAGGLSILAGLLVVALAAPPEVPGSASIWLVAVAGIAAISLIDDIRGVPPVVRLMVQAPAALAVALQVYGQPGEVVATVATAVAIDWGANLFNFMDGSDGLAAAMAIVGFTAFAIAAAHAGAPWLAYASIAVSALPFFLANRPPASMFMGDIGAVPLGFLAAALAVAGTAGGAWPGWFPLLVFLPFLADATLTLLLRAWRRERVWEAHRSHFYQRLHTLGAGHRGTLAIYLATMLACAGLALACLVLAPALGTAALAAALAAHLTAFGAIDYHERKRQPR